MSKVIKKIIFSILMALSIILCLQTVNAKGNKGIKISKNFNGYLAFCLTDKYYDKNKDGYLNKKEIKKIKEISIVNGDGKIDFKGI